MFFRLQTHFLIYNEEIKLQYDKMNASREILSTENFYPGALKQYVTANFAVAAGNMTH